MNLIIREISHNSNSCVELGIETVDATAIYSSCGSLQHDSISTNDPKDLGLSQREIMMPTIHQHCTNATQPQQSENKFHLSALEDIFRKIKKTFNLFPSHTHNTLRDRWKNVCN